MDGLSLGPYVGIDDGEIELLVGAIYKTEKTKNTKKKIIKK